ncbi:MAG: pyridoxal-phosphate dependent enzyme [Gammaproteobacteria bacterium]|nr:pyridoxal-phosphate dependent enzyme [Gammaproteobacteria bacterium]
MPDANLLNSRFPALGRQYPTVQLATLPTPVIEHQLRGGGQKMSVFVKCDDRSAELYGGNKVRKLEYLLARARRKKRRHIATFGAVGSHHALATALFAEQCGFECTCFLSHQRRSPSIATTLNMHLRHNTEIVRYGGRYSERIATLRQHLWPRDAWVIPAGGSSWLGTLGFVNAGLELGAQVDAGELPVPDRIYVAAGTLGTVAGLALGLVLAGLPSAVHAVRVTEPSYSGEQLLQRLLQKTAMMLHRADATVPAHLDRHINIRLRHSFFAGGYAHCDDATRVAVRRAKDDMNLELEATYTGKAMAALLSDIDSHGSSGDTVLFWNTYSSAILPVSGIAPQDTSRLPADFLAYYS